MIKKIFGLHLLWLVYGAMVFGQNNVAIIDSIEVRAQGTDRDILSINGQDFDLLDQLRIEPLSIQAAANEDYQWLIILPNADFSQSFKQRINALQGVFSDLRANVLQRYTLDVVASKSLGILKSTVLIKVKVDDRFFVSNSQRVLPIEDVAENGLKEILFRRGLEDESDQFLEDKKLESDSLNVDDFQLNVPILKINIIGADGAKSVITSKATQLSIFINEQRREEISQKFGIQFFVNNISIDNDLVLPKTIIYYRYDLQNEKLRFLKEALYIAKIIPSESIIKPMLNQNQKPNVDIEIYVGKNLR